MHRSWFRPFLALTATAAALAVPAATTAQPPPLVKTPTAVGTGGAAATVDVLATEAAVDALRSGANAVDAAVVAAAVLGVTEPFSCGIGGGGFMVIRTADGEVTTIDGRETAPAAMHPDSFWEAGAPLPFNARAAAGSPPACREPCGAGTRRWALRDDEARERRCSPRSRSLATGFVVDQTFFDQTLPNVDFFDDVPSTAAIYLDPDGTPRDVGTLLPQPRPGAGVRAHRAPRRQGLLPRRDRRCDGRGRPGPADRRRREPRLAPRRDDHARRQGLRRARAGAGTSGLPRARHLRDGPAVERRLDRRRGAQHPRGLRLSTTAVATQALHLFLEASRFSFADRNAYLADPDFFDVPLDGLLSDGFAAERRGLINPAQAAVSPVPPGDPFPSTRRRPGFRRPRPSPRRRPT